MTTSQKKTLSIGVLLILIIIAGVLLLERSEQQTSTSTTSTSTATSTSTSTPSTPSALEKKPRSTAVGVWKWDGVVPPSLAEEGVTYNNNPFTLTLQDDGSVGIQSDCNSIGGNFTTLMKDDGNSTITFSNMISTMMFCEGSKETILTSALTKATTYGVDPGTLVIRFGNAPTDILTFTR